MKILKSLSLSKQFLLSQIQEVPGHHRNQRQRRPSPLHQGHPRPEAGPHPGGPDGQRLRGKSEYYGKYVSKKLWSINSKYHYTK